MRDEGFIERYGGYVHMMSCKKPLKPNQTKRYKPPKETNNMTIIKNINTDHYQ